MGRKRITTPNTQCDNCRKPFRKYPSDIRPHNFCSAKCQGQWLKTYLAEHPRSEELIRKMTSYPRTEETRQKLTAIRHQWFVDNPKGTPKYEALIQKQRDHTKERMQKLQADPERFEKYCEQFRAIKKHQIPNILKQLDEGKSKKQLAKELGITRASLIFNLRVRNIPREPLPPRYEPNLEATYHLGYVLGVIYGDGYCWLTKGTSHTIGLGSCDKEFTRYFSTQLCKVLRREKPMPIRTRQPKTKETRQPYHTTCLRSRKLGLFIKSLDMKKLEEIINTNQDCKIGFVRGLFDSEGCLCLSHKPIQNRKTRWLSISITNTNKELLEITKRSLADLDIRSFNVLQMKMENKWNKKPLYHLGLSGSKDNIKTFANKIGTRIDRKKRNLKEWKYQILPLTPIIEQQRRINIREGWRKRTERLRHDQETTQEQSVLAAP